MKVTKIIRDYVEREVRKAIYKKYEDEENIAAKQRITLNNIKEKAEELATQTAIDYIKKEIVSKDYLEFNNINGLMLYLPYQIITIKNSQYLDNVQSWKRRADNEVKEKVEEILVTCELGGTKAELDEMLRNI